MNWPEALGALERAVKLLHDWNLTWEGDPAPSELLTKDVLADAYEALEGIRNGTAWGPKSFIDPAGTTAAESRPAPSGTGAYERGSVSVNDNPKMPATAPP